MAETAIRGSTGERLTSEQMDTPLVLKAAVWHPDCELRHVRGMTSGLRLAARFKP